MVLPPGGIISVLLLAWLLRRRWALGSKFLAGLAICCFCLFSLPIFAGFLISGLEDIPVLNLSDPRLAKAQAIVVLGGGRRGYAPEYGGETVHGRTLERIRYGVRLQRATGLPLAVTGGAVFAPGSAEGVLMARVIEEDFNTPVRWVESRSRNTAENGSYTRDILKAENIDRIVLVSHVSHLHRAIDIFVGTGFQVLPAPTVYRHTPDDVTVMMDWFPSASAFYLSRVALHEYLGRLWYWLGRWFT